MEILYSDKKIVVCIKPVGVDSEKQFPQMIKEELKTDVFAVHRLDLNVGGVMVYALTKQSAAYLSKLIQDGKMVKEYVALVHGTPPQKATLTDLLWKDSSKNKVFVVKRMRKGVKEASLEYEVKKTENDVSLLKIKLHTGRSHQIRVQFSSRGYSLLGDHKYGARDDEKSPMLYSCSISFPYGNENATFTHYPSWCDL